MRGSRVQAAWWLEHWRANGLAEGFIRAFKRDYVCINPLLDLDGVLRHHDGWFEDCSDNYAAKCPASPGFARDDLHRRTTFRPRRPQVPRAPEGMDRGAAAGVWAAW